MKSIQGQLFCCSWSGGKDSCLALHQAIQNGGRPQYLLTMLTESGERSRSHGLPLALLQRQAQALRIPLVMRSASWAEYEAVFISALSEMETQGIRAGVFGDIDIEAHRQWCEGVCATARITAYHPLWQRKRRDLLEEFIRLGFKAMIVTVKQSVMDRRFLGRMLDPALIREIEDTGIDASGERGEYHTVVIDGPRFSAPVPLVIQEQVFHDGYWFLDVAPG